MNFNGPLRFELTAGQTGDAPLATELLEALAPGATVIADNSDNSDDTDGIRSPIANLQKLGDAERQVDDIAEQLVKAEARQREMVLTSPIDGTVSALSVTTVGQVVGAGEELMRIVPEGIGQEIEAYIVNRDIGFIHPGQVATVKIEALPFTRYGTIEAELVRIAGDAIPQPEAEKTEGNPTQSMRETGFAGAQRTQNLVFPAILRPKTRHLSADGVDVPLSPGMAVTVEIKTGSRRILEYLLSPLVEVGSEAMGER